MQERYRVALVVDPEFGEALLEIATSMHVWAVGTPTNRAAASTFWARLPKPYEPNFESGITTFNPNLGNGPQSWCQAIVGTVDEHHDEASHDPPYTQLLVYGLQFNEELRPSFLELGFTRFNSTTYGFCATKGDF